MIQELFRVGPLAVSPFGVMLVLAFAAGYLQLAWGLKRLKVGDEEDASSIVFAGGVGGIVGAKVYYSVLYGDWRLLFERSGLVWYGGFLLGAAAVVWVVRRRRLPAWATLDAATPGLALGYAVGRIGCFLVGDDYGAPTDLPWGVIFPTDPDQVPRHPSQLYEAALEGALLLVLLMLAIRAGALKRPGLVAGLFAIGYGLGRIIAEFFREPDPQLEALAHGLTMGMVLSAPLVVIGLWLIVRSRTAEGAKP